ncbi:hypothetical protein F5Y17DRAFT_24855 [Xylariaceae sp. FL0594]|nr:hypothetical protein F5Y17DRAFT_24855 [Xylariaceae sp. FL0594]
MGLFKSVSSAGRGRSDPTPPSNIRGKISSPIPIPDDEFPIGSIGTGLAQGGIANQPGLPTRRESVPVPANTASPPVATLESKTSSLAQSSQSHDSAILTPVRRRRTNRSSALRYSTLSEATDSGSPSRKKSTLRVAVGRIFGRRNKKSSRSNSDSEAQGLPSDRHQSVSAKHGPSDSDVSPKRSASLPVTEYNKALRSHSIGSHDFMAIHSVRNSLHSDTIFYRRRAATASGGIPSFGLREDNPDVTGLSPRPQSAHERDVIEEHGPDAIGRAVSTDILASHRRSRSLSQLPDVVDGSGLVRKRSEEIRYWRESHNPGPLSPGLSSLDRGEPEPEKAIEPVSETSEEAVPTPTDTAPEPFSFKAVSLKKITEAASLEDRVTSLESQNQKLERLVAKLYQVVPGIGPDSATSEHVVLQAHSPPPEAISVQERELGGVDYPSTSYSTSQRSNQSYEDDSQTFVGSLHPPSKEAARPISNVTIRGATSLSSLPKDVSGGLTSEHYNSLRMLLDAERAARLALEARVTRLTRTVKILSRTTHILDTNMPSSGLYPNVSTFEDDEDDDVEPLSASVGDVSEDFRTSADEYPAPGYYESDEESHDDDVDDGTRKRAARTLSLGQLTHGKPKHSQRPAAGVDL